MTLYDLTGEYKTLLEMAEDPEVDADVLTDTLDALGGEIEEKADGYARVLKQMDADAAALKAEEKRLATRRTVLENNMSRMRSALQMAMTVTGKTKFKTELFSFSFGKSSSVIVDNKALLPDEYLVQTEPRVDKIKLKADLKAGKDLAGIAHLEQTEALRIR